MTAFGSQGGLWIPAAAAHVADHLHAGEPVPRWPAS
jgi:hypothetical protein